MRRTAFAAAVMAAAAGANPAGAEQLVSSLSSHHVLITPSFTGTELVLFGVVEHEAASPPRRGGYDIVATVTGPRETLVVRRKERVLGIWVNVDSRTFVQVPSYLAVLSTKPVEQIASTDVLRRLQIGIRRTLLPQQIGPDTADVVRDDPFRMSFLRLKQSRDLYVEQPNAVTFITSRSPPRRRSAVTRSSSSCLPTARSSPAAVNRSRSPSSDSSSSSPRRRSTTGSCTALLPPAWRC